MTRRITGDDPRGSAPQHQPYVDGTTHVPMYWPPRWFGGDGLNSMSATPERTLSTSATVIDNVIPVVYGTRKVAGMCAARSVAFPYVTLGFVFCYGDQAYASGESDFQIQINGEDIADCVTAGWVLDYDDHPGDGSTEISPYLLAISGWAAGDTTLWQSLCHVAVRINAYNVELPSSLSVTAIVGGRQIDNTWRADGGASSPIASTNPVEIAYDIMTNVALWRGVDSSRIDTTTWEAVAAWCEEDPGDATARWSYDGIIQWRDPDAAMEEVLHHCFAAPYVDLDGKVRLWADMPPAAITGDWSCSGVTVTEDATSGSATTELSAGDMVFVGSSLRTVTSVTNDDTFVINSSATESAAKVRPITGVEIYKHNWMGALEGTEVNKTSTADKVVVRWTDPDEWGNRETVSTEGSPSADHYKQVEVTYSGCTNNSMATRLGTHKLSLMWDQPYYWTGVADGSAADLEPGDVFVISDDILNSTPVRLLPPKTILPNGGYQLNMREFDIGVYTNVTASPVTGAPAGGGWGTNGNVPRPAILSANGTFTNDDDLVFSNDTNIYVKDTSGGAIQFGGMSTSDVLAIGDPVSPPEIAIYGDPRVHVDGCRLELDQDYYYTGRNSEENPINLAGCITGNVVELGSSSYPMNLQASQIEVIGPLKNDVALTGKDGGGTQRQIAEVKTDVVIGDTGVDTIIVGSTKVNIQDPLLLSADGIAWDDLRVSATSAKPGASNPPGFSMVRNDGGSPASTGVYAYVFDASTEEELFFAAQLPHRYKPGTDIKAHVHWSPTTNGIGTQYVVWGLEYTWSNINGTFGNTTLISAADEGSSFVADEHRVLALGTITGTGKTESSMLLCRVYRDATSSTDDFGNDAALLEIDFHYQVEKLGTEDEYPA